MGITELKIFETERLIRIDPINRLWQKVQLPEYNYQRDEYSLKIKGGKRSTGITIMKILKYLLMIRLGCKEV